MLQCKRQRPSYRGVSRERLRERSLSQIFARMCGLYTYNAFPACTSFSVHFFSLFRPVLSLSVVYSRRAPSA